jgi:magnesium-protoporphyrin O-methyltransferase
MPSCCSTEAIAGQFDRREADDELRRYRRDGPLPTTQALIHALEGKGVADAELLDIGAGVGAIHHALLERGARRAVHVDISRDYIEAARTEVERRGHGDRVEFVQGDFVGLAPGIATADVVTLDRVICCYPDVTSLVSSSARKARRMYGAVFPRDRAMIRLAIAVENAMKRIRGSAFRSYLHPPALIDELLHHEGFTRARTLRTWFWEVVVYTRTGNPREIATDG